MAQPALHRDKADMNRVLSGEDELIAKRVEASAQRQEIGREGILLSSLKKITFKDPRYPNVLFNMADCSPNDLVRKELPKEQIQELAAKVEGVFKQHADMVLSDIHDSVARSGVSAREKIIQTRQAFKEIISYWDHIRLRGNLPGWPNGLRKFNSVTAPAQFNVN